MNSNTIGVLSGILVLGSSLPYAIRVWQRKITPNIVSWFVWSVLGFALLVNYKANGAKDALYPAVFGFFNPILITFIAIFRGQWIKPVFFEFICFILGCISIGMWWYLQNEKFFTSIGLWYGFQDQKVLGYFGLLLAIFADMCAAIPTLLFCLKNPEKDRPLMWLMYAFGYGLSLFAITEHTFMQYILPVYMFIFPIIIAIPLIQYRIKKKLALNEWI